jgi:hypothetical protein
MEWRVRYTVRYVNGSDIPNIEEPAQGPTLQTALTNLKSEIMGRDHGCPVLAIDFVSANHDESKRNVNIGYQPGRIA